MAKTWLVGLVVVLFLCLLTLPELVEGSGYGYGGIIKTDGDFVVHNFTTNGTFNITGTIINATILIVAGGGGGSGGGGGAGGLVYLTGINITTNMTVIVGQGGQPIASNRAGNGTNSSFGSYQAWGGGGGGYNRDVSEPVSRGCDGGSGGGGGVGDAALTIGGLGLPGQGYNGSGSYSHAADFPGGGGGGASTPGALAVNNTMGGDGGNGTLINITGVATYFAGGGGGGVGNAVNTLVKSQGGLGGGGNGGQGLGYTNGTNGLGGGSGGSGGNVLGGTGGSGIVIVRYLNVTLPSPNVSVVNINPAVAYDDTKLTCNATVSGGNALMTVNYVWYNGTVLFTGGNTTVANNTNSNISVLSQTSTAIGERWTCSLRCSADNVTYSDVLNATRQINGILRNSSIPSDIGFGNLFDKPYNTTYNYWLTQGNSFVLYHKTNSTRNDITYYENGTAISGWQMFNSTKTNTSQNLSFSLEEHYIYPATYNLDFDIWEDNAHSSTLLSGSNSFASIELLNMSNDTAYNVFEFMANATSAAAASLVVRYCNSSYDFQSDPAVNTNCIQIGSILAISPYNHSHSPHSSHSLLVVGLNTTTGSIGTVKVTSKSYFVFRTGNVAWNIWSVSNSSRVGVFRTTANSGNAWTNSTATPDVHLHQIYNDTIYYGYACYNETVPSGTTQVCSDIRVDAMDVGKLPPTAPNVYSPIETIYWGRIDINWTASFSETGQSIYRYNVTIKNSTGGLLYVVANNSPSNLNTKTCAKSLMPSNVYCYQETANISSGCGGLATGKYGWNSFWVNVSRLYDEDWATYSDDSGGDGYFYVNYTLPSEKINWQNTYWQARDLPAIFNMSLPTACVNYATGLGTLNLLVINVGAQVEFLCKNDTYFQVITTRAAGGNLYEEAMWWNLNRTYYASVEAVDNESYSTTSRSPLFQVNYVNHTIIAQPNYNQTITALVTTIGCNTTFAQNITLNAQIKYYVPGGADNPYYYNFTAVSGQNNYTLPLAVDGYYNYSCVVLDSECTDGTNETGQQQILHDGNYPTLIVHQPTPNQVIETIEAYNNITFNYTATDSFIRDKCWYRSDNGVATVIVGCANFTLYNLTLGTHTMTIYVNDTSNQINSSTFLYILGRMAVTQTEPEDELLTKTLDNINFSCNITTYSGNITAALMMLQDPVGINTTLLEYPSIQSNSTYVINASYGMTIDGNYSWYCSANNSANYTITSTTRTITLDRTAPTLRIDAPTNGTTFTYSDTSAGATYTIRVNYTLLSNDVDICLMQITQNGTAGTSTYSCNNKSYTYNIDPDMGEIVWNITVYDWVNNSAFASVKFASGFINTNLTNNTGTPIKVVNNNNFSISVYKADFGGLGFSSLCNISSLVVGLPAITDGVVCTPMQIDTTAPLGTSKFNCTPKLDFEPRVNLTTNCQVGNYKFSTVPVEIFVDTLAPQILSTTFPAENQSIFNRNLTATWQLLDSNLFRINVTIDGVAIRQVSDINVSELYPFNVSYNTSGLKVGRHTLKLEAWDSHTATQIGEYDVSRPLFSNKITYDTQKGNVIGIEAVGDENVILNPFTTTKLADRYTFDYKPTQPKAEAYTFEVTTTAPIHIIDKPNSKYKKWIVTGNNWVDFYTPELDTDIDIQLVDERTAQVVVTKRSQTEPGIKPIDEPIEVGGKGGAIIGGDTEIEAKAVPETDVVLFSSIGDLNLNSANYTFWTHNVTMYYSPTVTETAQQQTWLNITHNATGNVTSSVVFVYNGTQYPTTSGNGTYKVNYLADFTTPTVTAEQAMKGQWNLTFMGENATFNFTQTVHNIGFVNCNQSSENVSLTICGIDEETLLNVSNMSLNIDFNLWIGSESIVDDLHYAKSGNYCYSWCLTPANTTFNVYSIMEYGDGTEYTDRKYYLYNMTLNTSDPKLVWLYHLNTSLASVITYNIINAQTGANVPDSYIKIQRYYPELNEYATVEIERTDQNGKAIEKMVLYNVFYRELVDYPHGTTRLQTAVAKLVATTRTLAIGLGTDLMAEFSTQSNTKTFVECDDTLGRCSVAWSTTDNSARTIRLDLYESTGVSMRLINTTTNAAPSSSGQLYIYANPYKNNTYYEARAYIIGSELPSGKDSMNNKINIFSQSGNENLRLASLVPLILLTIVIVCALLDIGVVGVIIGSMSGLIVGMFTSLIPLNITGIISIVLMAGILIYKMVK